MTIIVDVPEQYLVDCNPVEFGQRMKLSTALLMRSPLVLRPSLLA